MAHQSGGGNVVLYAVAVSDTVDALFEDEFKRRVMSMVAPSQIEDLTMALRDRLFQAYLRGLEDGYVQGVERATEADAKAYSEQKHLDYPLGCGMGATQKAGVADLDPEELIQRWFCAKYPGKMQYIPCEHLRSYWREQNVMRGIGGGASGKTENLPHQSGATPG